MRDWRENVIRRSNSHHPSSSRTPPHTHIYAHMRVMYASVRKWRMRFFLFLWWCMPICLCTNTREAYVVGVLYYKAQHSYSSRRSLRCLCSCVCSVRTVKLRCITGFMAYNISKHRCAGVRWAQRTYAKNIYVYSHTRRGYSLFACEKPTTRRYATRSHAHFARCLSVSASINFSRTEHTHIPTSIRVDNQCVPNGQQFVRM